jgi:hypothetical protein
VLAFASTHRYRFTPHIEEGRTFVTTSNCEVDRLKQMARDVAYTSVGLGILTFQKAQVRRRELIEEIEQEFPHATAIVTKQIETTVSNVAMLLTSLLNSRTDSRASK